MFKFMPIQQIFLFLFLFFLSSIQVFTSSTDYKVLSKQKNCYTEFYCKLKTHTALFIDKLTRYVRQKELAGLYQLQDRTQSQGSETDRVSQHNLRELTLDGAKGHKALAHSFSKGQFTVQEIIYLILLPNDFLWSNFIVNHSFFSSKLNIQIFFSNWKLGI